MKSRGKKKKRRSRGNNWSKPTTKKERAENRQNLLLNEKDKLFQKWMNFTTSLDIEKQKNLLKMLPKFWGSKSDDVQRKKTAINHIMNLFPSLTIETNCPSVHAGTEIVDLTSDCATNVAETTGSTTKDPEAGGDAAKDAETTGSTTKDPEAGGDAAKDAESTGSTTTDPEAGGDTTKDAEATGVATKDAEATGVATKDPEATGVATKDPEATGDTTTDAEATGSTAKDPAARGDTTTDAEATGSTAKDPAARGNNTKDAEATGSTAKGPEATGDTTKDAEAPGFLLHLLAASAETIQTSKPDCTPETGTLTNTHVSKTTRSSRRHETLSANRQSSLRKKNMNWSHQQLIQKIQQDNRQIRVKQKSAHTAAVVNKSEEIIERKKRLQSKANSLNGNPNGIFSVLLTLDKRTQERDNLKSTLARAHQRREYGSFTPWVREMSVEQTVHDRLLRFVELIDEKCFVSGKSKLDDGFEGESWYDLNVQQKKVCYYHISLEYIITYCTYLCQHNITSCS